MSIQYKQNGHTRTIDVKTSKVSEVCQLLHRLGHEVIKVGK